MHVHLFIDPALLTPVYNGQFRLSKQKAHISSVKLTCLIQAIKTLLCPASHSRTSSTLLYGHRVLAHFHDICHCVLLKELYPVQRMTDFLALIRFQYEKNSCKIEWHVWFWIVRCLPSQSGPSMKCSTSYYTHRFQFLSFLLQSLLLCIFISIKNVSVALFSKNPLNTGTRIKRSTMICHLSVCINRITLYI